MTKPARRQQGDFLHVLEGGKDRNRPAKTSKSPPPATGKKASPSKPAVSGKKTSKKPAKPKTPPRKTPAPRRHRQHSLRGLGRAWRGTRQHLGRRFKGLGKSLGRRRRDLLKRLKSRNTRLWLSRQVNWLILGGVLAAGAALAWGSHWLVERRSEAGLAQLLALGEAVARGEKPAPALLENPWDWRPIRIEERQGSPWLQVDGVSLSGCRRLIERTRGRFAGMTVNEQEAIPRACDTADNALAFRITPVP